MAAESAPQSGSASSSTVLSDSFPSVLPYVSRLGSPRRTKKETGLKHTVSSLFLARPKGFEPLTFWSVARRSIQLS